MEKIIINGAVKLAGEVSIGGSKNSLSAILPAACLKDKDTVFTVRNVPGISDVKCLCDLLTETGLSVEKDDDRKTIRVYGKTENNVLLEDNVRQIRASSLFLGALTAATGEAKVPFCGGDRIGDRPIDIHIYVLEKFGVMVHVNQGIIECKAKKFPLDGKTVFLRYPSVGATETAILLAVKAVGESYIYNAACEPEITDMAVALNAMGANIIGAGTSVIHIKGVEALGSLEHEIIPDRLECATYLLAFAVSHGTGSVKNVIPEHNMALISLLKDIGIEIRQHDTFVEIDASNPDEYSLIRTDALPHPGMPTDVQPLLSALAVLCKGISIIKDSVFVERFQYVGEYKKMGVDILKSYNQIYICGPQRVQAATVVGEDIRTATCLTLAALSAIGKTTIYGYEHIRRGYEKFAEKMNFLGANIIAEKH